MAADEIPGAEYWVFEVIATREETARQLARPTPQLLLDLQEGWLVVLHSTGELARTNECCKSSEDALIAAQRITARTGRECHVLAAIDLQSKA